MILQRSHEVVSSLGIAWYAKIEERRVHGVVMMV